MKNKKLLFVLLMHILCINHIYTQGLYEKVTSVEQIESGGVFIIVRTFDKVAMGKIIEKNKHHIGNGIPIKNIGTNDNIIHIGTVNSDSSPYEISIQLDEQDIGYFYLKNIQGYLYSVSNTTTDIRYTEDINTNNKYKWKIEIGNTENRFAQILNKSTDRIINYQKSSTDFRASLTTSSTSNIQLFRKIPADLSFPVTISSVKYATLYYNDKNLVVPKGIKAYTYKYVDDKLQISKTYNYMDIIPKGTAVVLHGNAGTYTFAEVSSEGVADENNILKGTDEEELIDDDEDSFFYMLSLNKDKDPASVGFYWGEENGRAFLNGANKAYLKISKNNVTDAKSSFCFSDITDETTHIASPVVKTSDNNYYTVQGIRVNYPIEKGIYIFNGKKVVIK